MTTEAKVGAFVLGCFSILAFTLIYLVNAEFSGHTVPYRTYLRYAGGLEPGASVLFGGINVGKVTAVRPAASDPTKIEILLDVKQNTPVNEKSVAKLGLISVMSGAALSITTGGNDARRRAFRVESAAIFHAIGMLDMARWRDMKRGAMLHRQACGAGWPISLLIWQRKLWALPI